MSLPAIGLLRERLVQLVDDARDAGRDVDGIARALSAAPDRYDALDELAAAIADAPLRPDWPYVEPDDLDSIWDEADPERRTAPVAVPDAADRVAAAFTGSVCGCMLGKPVEIDPTLAELRAVLEPRGEWPLRDYVTEDAIHALRWQQFQWPELARERIDHVAADDDINYTVLGMLVLEKHGASFTQEQLRFHWLRNLPVLQTFGPERAMLLAAGTATLGTSLRWGAVDDDWARWNVGADVHCGALIRADAYGYACLGDPARAAELAWRDATTTHRRTGVYGTMFVAAAIAAAPTCDDPLDIFRVALGFVPQRSRFAEAVRFALDEVATAATWLDAYERIHARYGEHGHCRILQEIGTLVNTLRFARDVGDGICIQVMQGNDTDSFGATAGSILGARFGPGHLEDRWVTPFRDRIQLSMAMTWETSLSALTARMAALPGRLTA